MQEMTQRLTEDLLRLQFEHHDACTSCGVYFSEGDTTHLGYGYDDSLLYVCDACSSKLRETAVRYYYTPRPYVVPDRDASLWRYMDLPKLAHLLLRKTLFFARSDTLGDDFEGAKGETSRKKTWDDHYLKFFREAIKHPPEGHECKLTDSEVESEALRLLNELEQGGGAFRKRTFISCWHENPQESAAMWRLYSAFVDHAVAIRTTYDRIYSALGRNPRIEIGRVRYMDYHQDFAGPNNAFWRKRKSFEHEREVRAIVIDHHTTASGIEIPCDISTLIDRIYVSPTSREWFFVTVRELCRNLGYPFLVEKSGMIGSPFY